MAEKALEESRNQASGYKGELEVARNEAVQLSSELRGLKVKVDELEVALNETSGESSTLSIDLAGFKSKLAMVEEALEQARTQSSEYEGELARAREALENEANEKRSMEEKFSKMCEELSQQGMQASEEGGRLEREAEGDGKEMAAGGTVLGNPNYDRSRQLECDVIWVKKGK